MVFGYDVRTPVRAGGLWGERSVDVKWVSRRARVAADRASDRGLWEGRLSAGADGYADGPE